jgi:hypothetical protein
MIAGTDVEKRKALARSHLPRMIPNLWFQNSGWRLWHLAMAGWLSGDAPDRNFVGVRFRKSNTRVFNLERV